MDEREDWRDDEVQWMREKMGEIMESRCRGKEDERDDGEQKMRRRGRKRRWEK